MRFSIEVKRNLQGPALRKRARGCLHSLLVGGRAALMLCTLLSSFGDASECRGDLKAQMSSRSEQDLYAGDLDKAQKRVENFLSCTTDPRQTAAGLLQRSRIQGFKFFLANTGLDSGLQDAQQAIRLIKDSSDAEELISRANLQLAFLSYSSTMIAGSRDFSLADSYLANLSGARLNRELQAEYWLYCGLVLENQANVAGAREAYNHSLAAARRAKSRLWESYATRHLGLLLLEGDPRAALPLLRKSLRLRERIGFKIYLPFSLHSIAKAYSALGNPAEAERYFQRAAESAERMGAPRVLSLILIDWSVSLRTRLGDNKATSMLKQAMSIADSIGYQSGSSRASRELARLIEAR